MVEEKWLDIKGFEGLYQVSNMGRVKSFDKTIIQKNGTTRFIKGRIMKTYGDKDYYSCIDLVDKYGKKHKLKVHRLVAIAFIPNPDNKPCIDHINTIKYDNRVENLRWVTYEENMANPITKKRQDENSKAKKGMSRPKGEDNPLFGREYTKVICLETKEIYYSIAGASRETNIDASDICNCCKGRKNVAGRHPITGEYLHWQYYSDYLNETEDDIKKIMMKSNGLNIVCVETGKVYRSIAEASRELGINTTSIGDCCKGKIKSVKGYHFEYI